MASRPAGGPLGTLQRSNLQPQRLCSNSPACHDQASSGQELFISAEPRQLKRQSPLHTAQALDQPAEACGAVGCGSDAGGGNGGTQADAPSAAHAAADPLSWLDDLVPPHMDLDAALGVPLLLSPPPSEAPLPAPATPEMGPSPPTWAAAATTLMTPACQSPQTPADPAAWAATAPGVLPMLAPGQASGSVGGAAVRNPGSSLPQPMAAQQAARRFAATAAACAVAGSLAGKAHPDAPQQAAWESQSSKCYVASLAAEGHPEQQEGGQRAWQREQNQRSQAHSRARRTVRFQLCLSAM